VAHICAIGSVAFMVGFIRIVRVESIVHPLGDPNMDGNSERRMRREVVEKALKALTSGRALAPK
jgi:betaine reductase